MRHSWPTTSQSRSRSTTPAAGSACLPPACSVARPSRGRRRTRVPGRRRPACWHGWDMTRTSSASAWGSTWSVCSTKPGWPAAGPAGAADAGTVGRGRPVGGDPSQPASARRGHRATSARVSTVRHWTPCPSPRRSRSKAVSSSTKAASCGLARQGNRRDSRLPLPAHGSSRRIPGQNALTYTSLGFPDPRRSPTQALRNRRDQPVCAVTQAVLAESRPRKLAAQPLLNHKRQFYVCRTYTRSQWSQDADLLIPGQG